MTSWLFEFPSVRQKNFLVNFFFRFLLLYSFQRTVESFGSLKTEQYFDIPMSDRLGEDFSSPCLLRKEVIQPHLPIRLPCYDFTPIISSAFDGWLLSVTSPASGVPDSHGVTGGVYKARERIHRGMLTRDY